MNDLILRFPDNEPADLELTRGVHAIGRGRDGDPCPVDDAAAAVAQLCVDRRGVWLQVREGARGLHINGRAIRRMAMLRGGDAIYLDGVEMALLGSRPLPAPQAGWPQDEASATERRMVLRGIGGPHHGRCFALDRSLRAGRLADSDIRIDEPAAAERIARLEPHVDGVVLRGLDARSSFVNGWPVTDALLRPGDQWVLDARHRFVAEAPMGAPERYGPRMAPSEEPVPDDSVADGDTRGALAASTRRLPWLLLAALMLAAALSLLLLYGVR